MNPSFSEPPPARVKTRQRRISSVSEGGGRNDNSVEFLVAAGEKLCSSTVWTWGGGKRGQMGQGDMLARNNPCQVEFSKSRLEFRVLKLAAGRHHCLALSDSGQVCGWGDNSQGRDETGYT